MKYLLDTNIVSEPLRPKPNSKVLARLRQHGEELAIPTIVWHELWYGCQRLPVSTRRTGIERYLLEVIEISIPIVAYDDRAAVWHASERARLAALGKPTPFADGQIASIAAVGEMTLVTLNERDYAQFEGLRAQNWARN
ncbi:MAG: type II toxin-antitoxin system VapC family toxin [Thermoflexales bacterium]